MIGEVLLHFVEHRAVKGLARGEAHVAQGLLQILGLDVLVALDVELRDRGTLHHHHQQDIAVAPQFDVAEEAGGIQCAHGLADALAIEMIADIDRQIIEYRAFGNSLQTLDADVAYREVILRRARAAGGRWHCRGRRRGSGSAEIGGGGSCGPARRRRRRLAVGGLDGQRHNSPRRNSARTR